MSVEIRAIEHLYDGEIAITLTIDGAETRYVRYATGVRVDGRPFLLSSSWGLDVPTEIDEACQSAIAWELTQDRYPGG